MLQKHILSDYQILIKKRRIRTQPDSLQHTYGKWNMLFSNQKIYLHALFVVHAGGYEIFRMLGIPENLSIIEWQVLFS